MLGLVVVALLAAEAPAPPAPAEAEARPRVKLLVLDVQSADLEKSQRETLTSTLAIRATRFPSLDVISSVDLRQLADLQADKAATGCDEASSSCMAELASALGAELVLAARAGKLDAVTVVTLQLFDVKNTSAEGRASVEGWDLPEVTAKMGLALDELLEKATGEKPVEAGTPTLEAGPRPEDSAPLATGLIVGGAVAVGVGLVAGGLGALPAFLHGAKKQELIERTARFDGTQEQLDQAAALQREATNLRQLYNGVGRFGVLTGVVLVPLGGAAIALGFLMPAQALGGAE